MIRALWSAATGMEAKQISLDITANNLANLGTVGFKKSKAEFQDLMYQVQKKAGSENAMGNQIPVGIEIGMGAKLSSVQKLFTQGDYVQTGNAFDLAIEGDGFFQIDDNGTTVYTRAGNFKKNKDGVLCNSEGLKLIPAITIPTDTVTFTMDSGGTWTCMDGSGNKLSSGKLELAKFVNPAGLASMGRNLFSQTDASGTASTGNAGLTGFGTVSQNFLEMSNVSSVEEMIYMIEAQRAYELNSKAIQTADSMLQTIANLKR
jgi:flagellar basal-body rod protein FlgG